MKVWKRLTLTTVSIAVVFVFASGALASVTIREGKGAGKARLGQVDSKAAKYLGPHSKTLRDPNYGSRIVYVINIGKRMRDGRYPCELLSNSSHKVIQLSFNSASFVTRKGIKVGSASSRLVARYPGMKRIHTTKFDHYILGRRPYTDFWVLNRTQRVYQIIVRSK